MGPVFYQHFNHNESHLKGVRHSKTLLPVYIFQSPVHYDHPNNEAVCVITLIMFVCPAQDTIKELK